VKDFIRLATPWCFSYTVLSQRVAANAYRVKVKAVREDKSELFEFPCSYFLKAIGRNTNEFYSVVSAIIEKHITRDSEVAYSFRTSSGNKYLSITATFLLQSRDQMDAIYQELNDHDLVLMTL
jgi:hypothetical protein